MKNLSHNGCFRCGWIMSPSSMISIVLPEGSERPFCASCFSLLLKDGKIHQVGSKYHFGAPQTPDRGELLDEISEILGYLPPPETDSHEFERYKMMKEAKELGMTAWIMSRHEFHGRKAEELCRQVIQVRKKRALREALRKASGETFEEDGKPGPNDSDLV